MPLLRKKRSKRAEWCLLSIILKDPLPNALPHLSHVSQQARQIATLQVQPLSEASSLTELTLVPKATRIRVLEQIIGNSDKQKQATSSLKANGMNCGKLKFVRILEEKDQCRNGCLIGSMILKVWGSFTFLFGTLNICLE